MRWQVAAFSDILGRENAHERDECVENRMESVCSTR